MTLRNLKNIANISLRNFFRNTSRYRLLVIALASAVLVQVLILGTILGMTETLRGKAARYFGGEIAVLGYGEGAFSQIEEVQALTDAVDSSSVAYQNIVRRSIYYRTDVSLFYEGSYQSQRRLIGIDWEHEAQLKESFVFISGDFPSAGDKDAILISADTAKILKISAGDRILVSLTTDTGQANTGSYVVHGIFDDPSFFGYSAYLLRSEINRLMGKQADAVSEIGVFLSGRASEPRAARRILQSIQKTLPAYTEPFDTQTERDQAYRARTENPARTYGVITLNANLAEIKSLLDAMGLIAAFLIALFLLIVIFGVGNTYKMVVYERTREIGTMRAVGLTKNGTVLMFLFEALFLGLLGTAVGFVLGIAGLEVIKAMDFSGQEAFLIFLSQGKIMWNLSLAWVVVIMIIIASASIIGGYGSARRAADLPPVEALRQD
jgi:putative ABC transport system permease protein